MRAQPRSTRRAAATDALTQVGAPTVRTGMTSAGATAAVIGRRALTRWQALPCAGAVVSIALCLLFVREAGFPLDDAWIHQDFARTLATTGQFALQPGRSAAGSTSPLWVALLTPPHLLTHGQAPGWLLVAWVAVLGTLMLAALGIVTGSLAESIARRMGLGEREAVCAAALAGCAVVCEWHLVWAALSGMETDLFALAALGLILAASRGARPWWLGLLSAITLTLRPEGTLVAALVVGAAAWATAGPPPVPSLRGEPLPSATADLAGAGMQGPHLHPHGPTELRRLSIWAVTWLLPFGIYAFVGILPYLLLNLAGSGQLLPSTISAKAQVADTAGTAAGVASYLGEVWALVVGGSPVLLVLMALAGAWWMLNRWRTRRGARRDDMRAPTNAPAPPYGGAPVSPATRPFPLVTLLWLWPLTLAVGYAGHALGVAQFGRYLIPLLPPLLALGATGSAALLLRVPQPVLRSAAGVLMGMSGALSLALAVGVYMTSVRFVDACQVDAALWLRAHTAPGTLVATHDVGAIGYFADRPVLDMAGLVDPQVVPLLRDQRSHEAYLVRRHVAYVAMATGWFPPPATLVHDLARREVYRSRATPFFVIYRTGW